MQIIVHTEFGVFKSKNGEATPEQIEETKNMLHELASEGSRLSFETEDGGHVIFSKQTLLRAVIEVA